jgi:hypothetical protein
MTDPFSFSRSERSRELLRAPRARHVQVPLGSVAKRALAAHTPRGVCGFAKRRVSIFRSEIDKEVRACISVVVLFF